MPQKSCFAPKICEQKSFFTSKMFEEKSCFAAFLRTENFWSKVFLRIQILWTKVFLRTQNVASNPKFLEKSLALHYNGWIKVLPRIQNFDLALHPKCLNKSLSLCPCLNKSLASNPQCLNKCSPTFHSSYRMTYKIRLDNLRSWQWRLSAYCHCGNTTSSEECVPIYLSRNVRFTHVLMKHLERSGKNNFLGCVKWN